jgi:hypothetical protein
LYLSNQAIRQVTLQVIADLGKVFSIVYRSHQDEASLVTFGWSNPPTATKREREIENVLITRGIDGDYREFNLSLFL